MKLLCVPCDEPMSLTEARGPDDGSMTVLFRCPACGRETAMLTNAMETQVVRSLGVKLGGRAEPARPMETIRSALVSGHDVPEETRKEKKCPFTGMVEEAYARESDVGPAWTAEAEERIGRIPSFARPMVRRSVEDYARERGIARIDGGVLDAVKGGLGF